MLFLKHVGFEVKFRLQLDNLLAHIAAAVSQVEGVDFKNIYFVKGKKEFFLFLECEDERKYHEWKEICPPPPGTDDWHEVFLTPDKFLPQIEWIPGSPAIQSGSACRVLKTESLRKSNKRLDFGCFLSTDFAAQIELVTSERSSHRDQGEIYSLWFMRKTRLKVRK